MYAVYENQNHGTIILYKKSIVTEFSCSDNTEEVRIVFEQVPDFIFYDERCPGPFDEQNALRGKLVNLIFLFQ